MLIDFHMHLFPDALAPRTLPHLSKISGGPYHTDGTAAGTLDAMKRWGIDRGVVLHIATKDGQQRTVNDFAKSVQEAHPELLCFGTVFPRGAGALEEVAYVRSAGLHGIKLHPAYQEFYFADKQFFPLYDAIAQAGLPLTLHAGFDPVAPNAQFAPPAGIAQVAKAFPSLTMIAAHMGGMRCWPEVSESLAGIPNVYFDTSMSSVLGEGKDAYLKLIRKHGAERILFGSDCPWNTAPNELALLESIGLTRRELDLILHQNAERLLGITV